MMPSCRISIVINSYNYAQFVGQAVESVLAQRFPEGDREILVVDDGSTDGTREVMAEYAGRVRYIRKENGGQASAVNLGVEMARGEVICLLDADDWFYPGKLSAVADTFRREPDTGVVYNRFDVVGPGGAVRQASVPRRLVRGDLSARVRLGDVPGPPTSGISVRRGILRKFPVPESAFRICADSFYLYILPLVANVGVLSEPLHAYRVHDRNGYLAKPEEQRLEIHRRQWGVIQKRAASLGLPLFDAFRKIESAPGFPERQNAFLGGVAFLARMRGSCALRAWVLAKLGVAAFTPPGTVSLLRRMRSRVTGETWL